MITAKENMNNYALYYPTIEFADYEWLWRASLVWDRIYRIVPDGYEPNDPPNVRALAEYGEIGASIHPARYAADIAKEFIERLSSREWDAAALIDEVPDDYRRLHTEKVDVVLRDMIVAKGSAVARGEWLHVPTSFAAHYMTYLANRIADRNNLQMLSDSAPAWTGATYFRFDGEVVDFPNAELTQQLATLVVRDFLPGNVLSIPPNEIIKFRQKYRDERQRFLFAVQRAAKLLSDCEDASIAKDIIEDLQKDINSALKDFRSSLSALNIVSLAGLKSVTFPVATKVASVIGGGTVDPTTLMLIGAGGAALGLVSGFSDYGQKRKRLLKESDYSYLLHLSREWKGMAMYNNDYNYYLCREMEEFIND